MLFYPSRVSHIPNEIDAQSGRQIRNSVDIGKVDLIILNYLLFLLFISLYSNIFKCHNKLTERFKLFAL